MMDPNFMAESVTTALAGLLVSDAYSSVRPRLQGILSRSRGREGVQIEDLDRLRTTDPATRRAAVSELVRQLAAEDETLLRRLSNTLGTPEAGLQMNVHDNRFSGPTQMGGIQIVNMHEAEHEREL